MKRLLYTILSIPFLFQACAYNAVTPTYASYSDSYESEEAAFSSEDNELGEIFSTKDIQENKADKIKAERKVIKNMSLRIEVKEPDTIVQRINQLAEGMEGYVVSSSNYYSTIRIPQKKMEETSNAIASLGKLKSKTESGEDITDRYLDLKLRLANAEKTRDRYLELLSQAVNVPEILSIEKELERLNLTIESLKGQLNKSEHLVSYATITVRVDQKVTYGPLGYVSIGLFKFVKGLFVLKS